MKIKLEEIFNHIEDIITTKDEPYYEESSDGIRIYLNEGGYSFTVTDATKDKVASLVTDINHNYKQRTIAALKRISISFNEPNFVFKVDEDNGRVSISDKGTLQQYDDIYKFNWFYGAS